MYFKVLDLRIPENLILKYFKVPYKFVYFPDGLVVCRVRLCFLPGLPTVYKVLMSCGANSNANSVRPSYPVRLLFVTWAEIRSSDPSQPICFCEICSNLFVRPRERSEA